MGVHSSVICGKKQVEDVGRDEMVSWTACICWHLWCLAGYVQVPYAQFMTSLYNCAAMCCTGRSQTEYTIVTIVTIVIFLFAICASTSRHSLLYMLQQAAASSISGSAGQRM